MYKLLANPIEHNGQRVLTTAQLAEAYGTDSKVISYNFNHNKDRYIEGKHYFCLTGDDLKKFKMTNREFHESLIRINKLYLWLEKGTLLHAKSLNTDKAWEVYDFLVDTYFRARQMEAVYNEAILKILENQEEIKKELNKLETSIDRLEKRQNNLRQYVKKEFVHMKKDIRKIFDDSLGKNNQTMIPALIFISDDVKRTIRNLISYYFDR
ncbi:MAG: ORF6N domain-containing protein [Ruminococcus sp.]|nr:ORF6N domain-containing protein [Ruminococcus sp.]